MRVGVVKETAPEERRVALVPETVPRLTDAGYEVLVEAGAGADAWYSDSTYAEAGATVVTDLTDADVVLSVSQPSPRRLRSGQTVIGILSPLTDRAYVTALASLGVTGVSLDGLPRTLSRAQAMDALSSQASVAGYKAVLIGASAYGGFFPLMITAAGTARPARVLVLGTGVAGLQAIGTARRLGALVTGYDVRPASRGEVESLGATFLELSVSAAGDGGYARELTPEERQAQQEELAGHIAGHDVLITTAQVPGRRPPLLVTEDAVKAMRAGSVAVDMGASSLGGNVFGSSPGETLVTDNGVTVIGATNLPSSMPVAASNAYSRNIAALLLHMTRDGSLVIDLSDEIQAGVVVRDAGD
jgi:H+-translocating NAD(P) transhydrogenase subunit alpha